MTFPAPKNFLILSAAAALLYAFAASAADLPQAEQAGDITYITGGIGDEERDALKSVESNYNLHVISTGIAAAGPGAFVGDTHITIHNRQGDELLSTDAGPIFYASLPPGHYVVEGEHRGETSKRNITIVSGKLQRVQFSWK